MSIRTVLLLAIAGVVAVGVYILTRGGTAADPAWTGYKERFVQADGRVVDTGNNNVSHTEGQGYAMLLAVAHDDRVTFDRVWTWTRDTLRRPDGLYAWRYTPGSDNPIADRNNATDGDLVLCWALLRASETWKRPADRNAAMDLISAMKPLVVQEGENAYLLPGIEGFTGENKRVVNLSYWVFPALNDIAAASGDTMWRKVIDTGLRLVDEARLGDHRLPPDWLETSGTLRAADGFPPRFGYDAIRVPLYVVWGGYGTPSRLGDMAAFWKNASLADPPPAWVDLTTGATSPEKQSPGMQAVTLITQTAALGAAPPRVTPDISKSDYYSASLQMLSALAGGIHARQ